MFLFFRKLTASLKVKISLITALIVFVIQGLTLSLIVYNLREDTTKSIQNQQFAMLHGVANEIDQKIAMHQGLLEQAAIRLQPLFSKNHWIMSERSDVLDAFLENNRALTYLFDGGLSIIGKDGKIIGTYPKREHAHLLQQDKQFRFSVTQHITKTIVEKRSVVLSPLIKNFNPHTDHPILLITYPIFDASEERVEAVLVGEINLYKPNFLGKLREMKIGRTGYFFVISTSGQMLVHNDANRIMKQADPYKTNPVFQKTLLHGFEGTEEGRNTYGTQAILSYRYLKNADWIIGSTFPSNEAYLPLRNLESKITLFSFIISFILLPIVWIIINHFMHRLTLLNNSILQIRDNPKEAHNVAILEHGEDEIAHLAHSFNQMLSELLRREYKLRTSKRSLANAQNIAHLGNWDWNYLTNKVFWSRQVFEILEINQKEPPTYNLYLHLVHPADKKRFRKTFSHFLMQKTLNFAYEVEHRIITASRKEKWVYLLARFELDENKQMNVVGTIQDITERKRMEEKLRDSSRLHQAILDTTTEGFYIIDLVTYRLIEVNDAFCNMVGYTRNLLVGKSLLELAASTQHDGLMQLINELNHSPHCHLETILLTQDNKSINVIINSSVLYHENGAIICAFAFVSNITKRKQAENALKLSHKVFENTAEAILITDANTNIILVNQAFIKTTGYALDEIIGHTPKKLYSGIQDKSFYAEMWYELHAKGSWRGEIWNKKKNGELYACILNINVVWSEDELEISNFIAVFSEITDLKETQLALQKIAMYDALTKLPNRAFFYQKINQCFDSAQRYNYRFMVLFLDLDGFKPVNDNYGHDIGDKLLVMIAERLSQIVGENNLAARFGGDEFTFLVDHLRDDEIVITLPDKLVTHIRQPYYIHEHIIKIGVSIGVAVYPDDGESIVELLRHADLAMYEAKRNGKNRWARAKRLPSQQKNTLDPHS